MMPDATSLHRALRESFIYLHAGDNQALKPLALDIADYEALKFLSAERGRTIGELREHLLIDKSRATRLVDALEARGLLRRVQNPGDRRSVTILLTPAGLTLRAQAADRFQTSLRNRLSKLTAEEQAQLAALLDKLTWSLLSDCDLASL